MLAKVLSQLVVALKRFEQNRIANRRTVAVMLVGVGVRRMFITLVMAGCHIEARGKASVIFRRILMLWFIRRKALVLILEILLNRIVRSIRLEISFAGSGHVADDTKHERAIRRAPDKGRRGVCEDAAAQKRRPALDARPPTWRLLDTSDPCGPNRWRCRLRQRWW